MSHYSSEDLEIMSDESISVGKEDSYDIECLCLNDSCESSYINDCESTNETTEDDTEDEFYLK